ncbi:hypothetical protein B5E84_12780 [Lachnoclostridium sp. An14]|uniref:hypothetical protein n=1 Tax=Lachnoclostridium sp. An14 TaxID=1965562 RepID=UPI000B36D610|nr:hypothetical protein [Lachnoclostridium sp. An14]OUQ16242.1 hypothetical protein B5E84_12780 [Lachnoclostridium sp. An14]
MSRLKKKAGILLCVFIAAIAVYFVLTQNILNREDERVYVSMEEATLPVVHTETMGREMNPLCGYVQDMTGAADSLTILPQDRVLPVVISGYAGEVSGIRYEIRSLDQQQLVERTTVNTWENGEDGVRAELPVQNLISQDKQYQLCLYVGLDDGREARYYTRILWTQDTKAQEMVDLAADFSEKTFDYEAARELTTYLEPSQSADNTTLGHVTLQSEFDQITWGGLDIQPVGEKRLTLKQLDGIMGNVELTYMAAESGSVDRIYEVTENFTMKWDSQRIYMMSYDRTMNEVFSGGGDEVSGKRILLGISTDDAISVKKSQNGKYRAFVSSRDLWRYEWDGSRPYLVRLFSFRGEDRTELRNNYNRHDIRVLNVDDSGNVDFLVYGYMNRGVHEGAVGAAFYRYQEEKGILEERFFFPASKPYEELAMDISRLAKLGANGMFYVYLDGAVYAVDLNSNEYLVTASGLTEGTWAVSQDQSRLAWQDGPDRYGAETIHLMNLETGTRQDIHARDGEVLRALGFVENDFIYGMAEQNGQWMSGNRVIGLPVYGLKIVDDNLNVETEYGKEGLYVSGVRVTEGRVHLEQLAKTGANSYQKAGEDIIVCNVEVGVPKLEGIGWYASEDRKKLYFVQLDTEVKAGSRVRVSAPRNVAYDVSDTLDLKSGGRKAETVYRAYGNGKLLQVTDGLAEAVAACYDAMGYVTDESGRIVWNRVTRPNMRTIREWDTLAGRILGQLATFSEDGEYGTGFWLMDGRGLTLQQALYYVGMGCPAAALGPDGSCELIIGYDQYNVTIQDPATGTSRKMGLQDAGTYFASRGNDFVCGLFTE